LPVHIVYRAIIRHPPPSLWYCMPWRIVVKFFFSLFLLYRKIQIVRVVDGDGNIICEQSNAHSSGGFPVRAPIRIHRVFLSRVNEKIIVLLTERKTIDSGNLKWFVVKRLEVSFDFQSLPTLDNSLHQRFYSIWTPTTGVS